METNIVLKAVVSNNGKVLLLRRSATDTRRPKDWDLPGGSREPNEDLIEGIKREVKEECGLDITNVVPIYSTTEIREWKDNAGPHKRNAVFIFFTAKTGSDNVVLSFEHDKYQWVDLEKAIDEIDYYLHKDVLKYIIKNNIEW